MKIFIFQPLNWSYCGGGLVISAESFANAEVLFLKEYLRRRKASYETAPRLFRERSKEEGGTNCWIVVKEIECSYDKEEIILYNYNEA